MFHACFLAIWVSFRMPWLKNPSSHLADENDNSIPKFGKKYLTTSNHYLPCSSMSSISSSESSVPATFIFRAICEHERISMVIQMCPPIVTLFGRGQSVTVGKRRYSHAYLLKERPFGTSWFCHSSQNVTIGVVTIGVHICTSEYVWFKSMICGTIHS